MQKPPPAAGAITASLARELAAQRDAELPEAVTKHATTHFLNVLALAISAADQDPVRDAVELGQLVGGTGTCPVPGRPERLDFMAAALVIGIAAHVDDFDDTHLRTVIHPGAPVVPAALAVGEHTGATLGQVVEAVAVGVELTLRIGVGLGQTHFARGWHITGTAGRFGAAAAAGRLIGLSPRQMQSALGVAATEAAGLQAAFGTMTKSFHAGKAAYDGVEAALLASMDFTSAATAIEDRRGYAPTLSDDPDADGMLQDLGLSWELESNAIKPYACGIVSHPAIDAGIELRRSGVRARDVASVRLRTNPVVLDVMGIADPADGLQSKFSVYHCFAVGLIDGAGGPEQFSDSRATDPGIAEFRRRITVDLDASVARDECFAEVDGAEPRRHHVEHATASKDRPMTAEQLQEKIRLVTAPVLGPSKAASFAELALHASEDLLISDLAITARETR